MRMAKPTNTAGEVKANKDAAPTNSEGGANGTANGAESYGTTAAATATETAGKPAETTTAKPAASGGKKAGKKPAPKKAAKATKKAAVKVLKGGAKASKPKGKRSGPSRRHQQRTLALQLGHANRGTIKVEDLREACRKKGIYNAPNFAQDMTKDAVLFEEIKKDGKRVAWKLTTVGKQAAKQLAKAGAATAKAAAN
jgi:hypothetical protein